MRIIKLAAGIPDGFVKIRIKINKQGQFEREIVREGKSTCKAGDDKRLLDDLLNTEVQGYIGSFGDVEDAGHTKEFQWPSVNPVPAAAVPEEEEQMGAQPQQPQRQREYGV